MTGPSSGDELVARRRADGRFPPPDGGVPRRPPDHTTGLHAVLSFTGHAVVATDRSREEVLALGVDGFGGAPPSRRAARRSPAPAAGSACSTSCWWPAGPAGAARPCGRPADHDDHLRVDYARTTRVDVRGAGPTSGASSPSGGAWAVAPRSASRWPRPAGRREGRAPAARPAGRDARRRADLRLVRARQRPQPACPARRRLRAGRRRGPPPPLAD